MHHSNQNAPGWPGIQPTWTSSAKSAVGTALSPASRVWFTLSHGIIDEVYYPRVDQACTRDLGLIVTDGSTFFSEEKRATDHEIDTLFSGVPAFELTNTCTQGSYTIKKIIFTDPDRDVLLQKTRFTPRKGSLEDYHLYALLAPHLSNHGNGNTAWVGDYKGVDMLFAHRGSTTLALGSSVPWLNRSAGFVGSSDGWQDLQQHKKMTWTYPRAEDGNVALVGEIDLTEGEGTFTLALGFGLTANEAGFRVLASLRSGADHAQENYIHAWQGWQETVQTPSKMNHEALDLFRDSASILRTHEAKRFPGGMIASLSIPWGFAKGDDDLGGYHLVWPRDLVEAAGALLAAGAKDEVWRTIKYLQVTQEEDGHWPQNMWLDGTPYWTGIQMDETAFPILLVDLANREGALSAQESARTWGMVRKAAGYLVRHGPITEQDRWEEDSGYSPFTLAVEIAALVTAADMAEVQGEADIANYLRETADFWNESIERWTYVTGTELAEKLSIEGYYIRITPPEKAEAASPKGGFVPIKNRPPGEARAPAEQILSPDALALVRFGLRSPMDERITNTVKAIDAQLKVETPYGPAWHRYNGDGYGEREGGAPFNGEGIGRAWPLLTGERAHYELAAGRKRNAKRLMEALINFTNQGGLIPEQVWDHADIPEHELFFGKASGSAMPLVWAHAEFMKLARSLTDGRVFDTPTSVVKRYCSDHTSSKFVIWRPNLKLHEMPVGKVLRVETLTPTDVLWRVNGQGDFEKKELVDTGMGVWKTDLPTEGIKQGSQVQLHLTDHGADRIYSGDFTIKIV